MFRPEAGRMAVLTEHPSDFAPLDFLVVAADHPSLIEARERFAATLRAEQRFFGRASAEPKPFPSLIAKLLADDGLRLAAAVDGEIIGLACLRADGEAAVAVIEQWRNRGVATELVRTVIVRGRQLGHGRIFLRSSHRSRAVAAMGDALGATVVDLGRGRIELIFDAESDARSA
jgi:GNAT superfamily N-acetyltransferase